MGRPEPASDGLREREGHLALPGEGEQPGHHQAEIKNLEATVKTEVTKKGKKKRTKRKWKSERVKASARSVEGRCKQCIPKERISCAGHVISRHLKGNFVEMLAELSSADSAEK